MVITICFIDGEEKTYEGDYGEYSIDGEYFYISTPTGRRFFPREFVKEFSISKE